MGNAVDCHQQPFRISLAMSFWMLLVVCLRRNTNALRMSFALS